MKQLALLAASAATLAAAAPAVAISGAPVSGALRPPSVISATKTRAKGHTCQAGSAREKATAKARLFGDPRSTAVVACEQPPRSRISIPTLKQTAPNPLEAYG